MAMWRRGWTKTLATACGLALVVSSAGCARQEGADDETPDGTAVASEPDGAGGTETLDLGAGDAATTVRVKTRFAADERVSALMIDVDTQNGIVTLEGDVESEAAKSAAEEVARGTEGVTDVVNMITAGGSAPAGEGGSSGAGQGSGT